MLEHRHGIREAFLARLDLDYIVILNLECDALVHRIILSEYVVVNKLEVEDLRQLIQGQPSSALVLPIF